MFLDADIASCLWLILTEQHRTLLYFIIISQWELSFELSQLPSSWLVLYILIFYLYSVPRLSFRRSFFFLFSTATNCPFCPSFLCPHLALFSLSQPLFACPSWQPLSAEKAVRYRAGKGADSSVFQPQILNLYKSIWEI